MEYPGQDVAAEQVRAERVLPRRSLERVHEAGDERIVRGDERGGERGGEHGEEKEDDDQPQGAPEHAQHEPRLPLGPAAGHPWRTFGFSSP
jgi:hypothetical protein